jgi:hypothetical protein
MQLRRSQLCRSSVTRRLKCLSEDNEQQKWQELEFCEFFSLQLDVMYPSYYYSDDLKWGRYYYWKIYGNTVGEDFYGRHLEMNVPAPELVPITITVLQPTLVKRWLDWALPIRFGVARSFSYDCIIHKQALCTKDVDFQHVMSVVQKSVNWLHARLVQYRLFKHLLH